MEEVYKIEHVTFDVKIVVEDVKVKVVNYLVLIFYSKGIMDLLQVQKVVINFYQRGYFSEKWDQWSYFLCVTVKRIQ